MRSYSEQEKALMKLDQGTTTQKSFIFDGLMRICQNIHEVERLGDERINYAPDTRIKGYEDENGRQRVRKKPDDVGAVFRDPCRPTTSEVNRSQEGDQQNVARQSVILPQQLGFLRAPKGGAAKPDASCAKCTLDDEPANGDQAKGLGKWMPVSVANTCAERRTYTVPCCEVRGAVRGLVV